MQQLIKTIILKPFTDYNNINNNNNENNNYSSDNSSDDDESNLINDNNFSWRIATHLHLSFSLYSFMEQDSDQVGFTSYS